MILDASGNAKRGNRAWLILGRFVLVAGFIALAFVPSLGKLLSRQPDEKISLNEQRKLAQFPKLSFGHGKLWEFPAAFERYFNDQFAFRSQLIKPYYLFLVSVFHVSPSAYVTIGKNYWYYSGKYDDSCGVPSDRPLPDARKKQLLEELLAHRDEMRKLGIHYYYFIAPAKKYVMSEDLPAYLRRFPLSDPMADVVSYIRKSSDFDIYYLGPELVARKHQFNIYYRYDSHWNFLGGLFASAKILSVIGERYKGVKPITLDDVEMTQWVRTLGDLQRMVGLPGYLTEMEPRPAVFRGGVRAKPANRDLHFPVSTRYEGYNLFNRATEIDDPSLPTAVFLSDSFGDYVQPYLSENFRRILYVRMPLPRQLDMDLIKAEKPDMVIDLHQSAGLGCYML